MTEESARPILVVDDNHDAATIVCRYLQAHGHSVAVALSGDDALVEFERLRPHVVILDVMMPGRSGWDVCRVMKQHATLGRSVRVIMLTALDGWDDKQEALKTGADDYATKPVDLADLAKRVQRNLELAGESA